MAARRKTASKRHNAYKVQSWYAAEGAEGKPGWVDRGTYPERAWALKRKRQIEREERVSVEVVPLNLKPAQHAKLPGVRAPKPPRAKRLRDTLPAGMFLLQAWEDGRWVDRGEPMGRGAALTRRNQNQADGYLFRVIDHTGAVVEPASDREFRADEVQHSGRVAKPKKAERPYTLERVKLDRGGYDGRGKYWGVGKPLFRIQTEDWTDPSGRFSSGDQAHFRAENLTAARKLWRDNQKYWGADAVRQLREGVGGTKWSPLAHESENPASIGA